MMTTLCLDDRGKAALARRRGELLRLNAAPVRDYWLYDESGRRLGTINAPQRQPTVGLNAPTFYLQRTLAPERGEGD